MNCVQVQEQLPEYLHRPSRVRRAKALYRHLAQCEDCREAWEFEKLLADTLRHPPRLNPPAHFAARLREQLQADEPVRAEATPRRLLLALPHVMAAVLFLIGIWAETLGPQLIVPTITTLLHLMFGSLLSLVHQMTALGGTHGVAAMIQVSGPIAQPKPSLTIGFLLVGLAAIPAAYFLLDIGKGRGNPREQSHSPDRSLSVR